MQKKRLYDLVKLPKFKSISFSSSKDKITTINAEEERTKRFDRPFDKFIFGLAVLILFTFLMFISLNTQSEFYKAFFGFSPTIFYVLCTIYLLEISRYYRRFIWLSPMFFSFLFYFLGLYGNLPFLIGMDIVALTFVNILISYTFAVILNFIGIFDALENTYKNKIAYLESEKQRLSAQVKELGSVTENNIGKYLQSIEDKCKAINFVIGRVYSNRHGGSNYIRNIIKVKKEWYNAFSKLAEDFSEEKREVALDLINKILDRLNSLFSIESDVFSNECLDLKNLERSKDCSDKVIDVLIANDKDPVRAYLESAIDYCLQIQKFLEN